MSGWPFFEEPGQIIIPGPVYALVALALLAAICFRSGPGASLYRYRYVFVAMTIWSWAALMPRTYMTILSAWESRYAVPDVQSDPGGHGLPILVLGAGDVIAEAGRYRAVMDGTSWARTEAAVKLWRESGGNLYFTGGLQGKGTETTARVMAEAGIALGADPDFVTVEEDSLDTWENLSWYASENPGGEFWLVTSAVHMRRAVASAEQLGLRPRPYPCDFQSRQLAPFEGWLPHNSSAHNSVPLLHEMVGIAYYRLRGRL